MREIKFRAWHEKSKNMLSFEMINALCKGKCVMLKDNVKGIDYNYKHEPLGNSYITFYPKQEWEKSIFEDEDFILEFSTGIEDKKGKYIYEGDIVEIVYNNNDDVTAVVKFIEMDAFYTLESVKNPGQLYSINFRGSVVDGVYVIGNIHENPELL